MKGLNTTEIDGLIELLGQARQVETESLARLALLLHLYLLYSRSRSRSTRRARWDSLLDSLKRVLASISPSYPPITLWLLVYYPHLIPERKWTLLEQRLSLFATQPPIDEIGLLACWLAAHELLMMAIDSGKPVRVTQALYHYKRYISGRYAHAVGKGVLSAVVESDLFYLTAKHSEMFEIEEQERSFIEDWFLARFAMMTTFRIKFNGKWKTWIAFLGFVLLTMTFIGILAVWNTNQPAFVWIESRRLSISCVCLGIPVAVSAFCPRVFRVFFPRLFAGSILGWSTLLGELGAHRLFAEHPGEIDLLQRLCRGDRDLSHSSLMMLTVLVCLPVYFLYVEAQAALGSKRKLVIHRRTWGVLVWAIYLVGLVGSLASIGLEKIVCFDAPTPAGHLLVFAAGCVISLYFTIVVHLVWGDEGMSATLAHEGPRLE